MFEKTLQDLVKGIRANKRDPSAFISGAIAEIKVELKSVDPFIKAQAVRKLTYLQMLGYDISWAAFSIVEAMTAQRFAHKRIGYLGANQAFTEDTEVVLLCTNHLKKELCAANQYDIGLAVNCLSNIATIDLARDLLGDVTSLLSHQRPYVRKKAILVLYKLFVKYPQGLRLTFDKIKERLDDPDSSVVSCAVNVICELADKNPRNYLAMAPKFFRLLTTSSNNWMLIKVVKLLGSLVPEEPRLARKLLEPLATIIQNTAAKSLLYECIHTVTLALPFTKKADGSDSRAAPALVKLCSDHLKQFIEDPDQNLKYLGLVGFVNLMASHPRVVAEHRELVLGCLADDDVTIRTRALELLSGMVTKRNLEELVQQLLSHVATAEGAYRDELLARIVGMCSRDKYAFLADFGWYMGVLVDLCGLQGSRHGALLAQQLTDVAMRVESVRDYAVAHMVELLLGETLQQARGQSNMREVLWAAAWIVGEYCSLLLDAGVQRQYGAATHYLVCDALTHPRVARLPAHVQCAYLQSAFKVFVCCCRDVEDDAEVGRVVALVCERLRPFSRSAHLDVQERACGFIALLTAFGVIKEPLVPLPLPPAASGAAAYDSPALTKSRSRSRNGGGGSDANGSAAAAIKETGSVLAASPRSPLAGPVMDLLGMDVTGSPARPLNGTGGSSDNGNGAAAASGGGSGPMMIQTMLSPEMLGPLAAARGCASQLAALCAEPLAPVNPKAQSKVPPPEDVDLRAPLDATALQSLLAERTGAPPPDMSRVSFTEIFVPPRDFEASYDSADSDASDAASGFAAAPAMGGGGNGGSSEPRRGGAAGNDPFYLSSAVAAPGAAAAAAASGGAQNSSKRAGRNVHPDEVNVDDIPMLRLSAKDLAAAAAAEGPAAGGRRRKERRSRPKDYSVNMQELMPAGAAASSDEGGNGGHGGYPGQHRKGGSKGSGDAALREIDITTPLGEDERMPELKHREVPPAAPPAAPAAPPAAPAGGATPPSAGATRKRGEKKHRHSKHREEAESAAAVAAPAPAAAAPPAGKSSRSGRSSRSGGGVRGGGPDDHADLLGFEALGYARSPATAPGRADASSRAARASPPPPPAASFPSPQRVSWEADLSQILSAATPAPAPRASAAAPPAAVAAAPWDVAGAAAPAAGREGHSSGRRQKASSRGSSRGAEPAAAEPAGAAVAVAVAGSSRSSRHRSSRDKERPRRSRREGEAAPAAEAAGGDDYILF